MTTPKGTAHELLGQGQRLSSQSQNVEGGIVVSIELDPATYAVMDTQGKGFFLPMPTLATVLRRIGWLPGAVRRTVHVFGVPSNGRWDHYPHSPDFQEFQGARSELAAVAVLRIGQRVVASWPAKTEGAWLFSRFDTPEEGFEGQVNPHRHILQDLRMPASQRGTLLLHGGEGRRLLVIGQQLLAFFPCRLASFKQVVIQPPAFFPQGGWQE